MTRLMLSLALAMTINICVSSHSHAEDTAFSTGPVFETMGPVADIDADMTIPKRAKFSIAFDTAKPGDTGQTNRTLVTAARFMNMHVKAGVSQKNIKLAVIVHGKASFDLIQDVYYAKTYEGAENPNVLPIKALTDEGVRIILCGQSAAYHGITKEELLPGVEMALSAMTAHALLQQNGYTLNPF